MTTKSKSDQMTTLINFILDQSGSMDEIRKDTIGGFNSYLKDLQKQKGKILFTLTVFADYPKRLFTNLNVKEVKPLTEDTYRPNGSTALYDAAVSATEAVKKEIKNLDGQVRVLTVVLTDGEENSSTDHDQACFRDLIEELEERGNWTFVYLGANQDSWANASSMGYRSAGNVGNFVADSSGIQDIFRGLRANTVAYMASADAGVKSVSNFNSLAEDNLKKNLKGGVK